MAIKRTKDGKIIAMPTELERLKRLTGPKIRRRYAKKYEAVAWENGKKIKKEKPLPAVKKSIDKYLTRFFEGQAKNQRKHARIKNIYD